MVMQNDAQADMNGQETENQSSPTKNRLNKILKVGCGITKAGYGVTKDLVVPILAVVVGGIFTWTQFQISNARQDADSADKAIETKEQVLTNYSKTISQLVTEESLGQKENTYVENIARGETFVALRRLDSGNDSNNPHTSKNDTGELKGLLIRYLYDTKLIGYDPNFVPGGGDGKFVIDLYGANITQVVLEDAWLPGIDLAKAEYNEGNFKNTNLTNAKLYQANFTGADFTGADIEGADFTNANLTGANFTNARNLNPEQIKQACYWEQAIYTTEQQQALASTPTKSENSYCSERWGDKG